MTGTTLGEYACPCGCRLQLTLTQQRKASRLLTIAGTHADIAPGHVSLAITAADRCRADLSEPSSSVRCRCSRVVEMPTYLVEWSARHGAPVTCSTCRGAS